MTDINKRLKNAIVVDKDTIAVSVADAEENDKLKGLLKELKRYFDADGRYYIDKRILLEINQVLGEE